MSPSCTHVFPVSNYSLAHTLASGQAFRWRPLEGGWEGVIGHRWVWLQNHALGVQAQTAVPVNDWHWLTDYLQIHLVMEDILTSFPKDAPLSAALAQCQGLRLLRQDPWECLASFLLSSTKQILQIQQIIECLCRRFGTPVQVPAGHPRAFSFPTPAAIAHATEKALRQCKMGFRAPYLSRTSIMILNGELDLTAVASLPLDQARATLMRCPGVGPKIADCVLLFGFGFNQAFPLDVWIMKTLRRFYFVEQTVSPARMRAFAEEHFGAHAGYAQQYLFHFTRTKQGLESA